MYSANLKNGVLVAIYRIYSFLQLQATPGMTVQEVVEAELPEVGQIAYQVYQFPSRALLNPEREVTVLKNQEISIEPMQTSMSGK